MRHRIFLVDVEASGRTPYSGVMTEFGVVDFNSRDWFHGHLWDFTPHPLNSAIPVPTAENPGVTIRNCARQPVHSASDVFNKLCGFVSAHARGGARPILVSDNPAYDFMWMADGFDRHGLDNPFGHSGRRIGDLAAGLERNWMKTSGWKRHRQTAHDHNPVNDALGNAEALAFILKEHGQIVDRGDP